MKSVSISLNIATKSPFVDTHTYCPLSLSGRDIRNLVNFDEEDRTDYKKESFKLKLTPKRDGVDHDYKTKVIEIGEFKWYSTFLIFYFIYSRVNNCKD